MGVMLGTTLALVGTWRAAATTGSTRAEGALAGAGGAAAWVDAVVEAAVEAEVEMTLAVVVVVVVAVGGQVAVAVPERHPASS